MEERREEQRKSHSEQRGPLVQQLPDRDAGKVSVGVCTESGANGG